MVLGISPFEANALANQLPLAPILIIHANFQSPVHTIFAQNDFVISPGV